MGDMRTYKILVGEPEGWVYFGDLGIVREKQ
jgi:hypothetical protein